MGWWKVQGTEDIVGDEPFDLLRDATERIAELYKQEFERPPTRSEWQILIHEALQPIEELESSSVISLFAESSRPRAVEVVVDPLDNPDD